MLFLVPARANRGFIALQYALHSMLSVCSLCYVVFWTLQFSPLTVTTICFELKTLYHLMRDAHTLKHMHMMTVNILYAVFRIIAMSFAFFISSFHDRYLQRLTTYSNISRFRIILYFILVLLFRSLFVARIGLCFLFLFNILFVSGHFCLLPSSVICVRCMSAADFWSLSTTQCLIIFVIHKYISYHITHNVPK